MSIRFIIQFFRFRSRAVRTKRYEILLPLNYNDGTEVEPEKFDQTAEELSDRFGGVTQDTVRITGTWKYGGARYRGELLRIRIDSSDPRTGGYLRTYKQLLKERVQQIDILSTPS